MSIRGRLFWLVAVATLVPALLVGLRFLQDRQTQIAAATERLLTTANAVSLDLNDRILSTGQLLYGLSRAQDLLTGDRDACSAFLASVREQYPQFTGILSITPEGDLFCDSLQTGRSLDLRDRTYFQSALQGESGVVVQPAFGRLTGLPVLQVAWPRRGAGGDLAFVLLASLNLGDFLKEQGRLMEPGLEVALVGPDGIVLAWEGATDHGAPIGEPLADPGLLGFLEPSDQGPAVALRDVSGATWIWAVNRDAGATRTGLRVLVGQRRAELVAAADLRLRQDLTILALISIGLAVAVWLIGEVGIRRQVVRISDMAVRLGQGDLSARILPPHPGGELGGLIAVLNQTAASLQRQREAIAELDRKLLQAQRMEAVGQLTGGLAHDFNNLLTVIIGSAELLAERLEHDPDLLQLAETTRMAAERGGELTRSLLAFARRQPLEPRATDVGAELRRMEILLRRTLGEHVECRFDLAPRLPPALVDPAQLEAALLNLVLNARDAMPQGGLLTVETAAVELDADYAAQQEEVTPGEYIAIAVTDTGRGMPAEVLAQVFEPFFTTKEFGRGSGLGLSMVYGFVKQSRGHVRIYSEPDHGTTVKLYLPRAPEDGPGARRSGARLATVGGHESVLVVEDDDMVRAHVVGELTLLGYQVLAARHGQEAMEILRSEVPVDVLFTDVVMPGGMSGPQLAASALLLRSGLRVLYTSGYTENAVVHHGRLDPGVVLLSKPYRRQELAEKLRQVLRTEAG
ncbi:ATP-binding protein [Falsiroseomonas selenitidurans]|uniref:histidine kinase n=1 Tax=Falsiroseomonas selenitidurans TaxID=2716335 RepID=A0ABX1E1S3_9PROT|nr:ATP-binding protein [Falsiroseomonas selenitidurans]NKC29768.1 response regulator [Falsiroseomonas selenitidurans]